MWIALYGYIQYPELESASMVSDGGYSDYEWIYSVDMLRYTGMRTRSVAMSVYIRMEWVHLCMNIYVVCVHNEFMTMNLCTVVRMYFPIYIYIVVLSTTNYAS
jgi:hypothetical protein